MNQKRTKLMISGVFSMLLLAPSSRIKAGPCEKFCETLLCAAGIAAGMAATGCLLYAALRPETSEEIKHNAIICYQDLYNINASIIDANYDFDATESLINAVIRKGNTHPHYAGSADYYLSYECKKIAPLLHGYAALLDDSEKLFTHHKKLIKCFGSFSEASREFRYTQDIYQLARSFEDIASKIKRHSSFVILESSYALHRATMKTHEQTERDLREIRARAERAERNARLDRELAIFLR